MNRECGLASHFKVQYAIALAACVPLLLWARRWITLLIALAGLGLNLTEIAPLYLARPAVVATGDPVKVLMANVLYNNSDYTAFLDFVAREDPDIVAILEYSRDWQTALAGIKTDFPYFVERAYQHPFGIALFSKLPLDKPRLVCFGEDAPHSITAHLTLDGGEFLLIVTHPYPPTSQASYESRNRQLQLVAEEINRENLPTICVGDLNITPFSPIYKRFTQQAGLQNSRDGFGILPTWPTSAYYGTWFGKATAPLLQIPIDHIFHSNHFVATDCRRGPLIGSDHRPLVAALAMKVEN